MLNLVKNTKAISRQLTRNMHLIKQKGYINGEWVDALNKAQFAVTNPATSELITQVADMNADDTQKAIEAATAALAAWRETTAKERSCLLTNWYEKLVENQKNLAEILTAEAGKPLPESHGEVMYGNSFIEFFAGLARHVHGEIIPSSSNTKKLFVEKQPIGVVGLITPWNFPHAMITRKAGAALAAGCTCIVKPAEDTPLTALALVQLAEEAGIPKGVLNVVTSDRKNAPEIGKLLCESPDVAGISFTGSTQVGKILYKQCSSGVKRIGLELGGNAPFIVYKSANIDEAVKGALAAKFRNCGQTCVSANRFLIQNSVHDEFVDKIVKGIKTFKIGNGAECGVNIGPLVNKAQIDKVSSLVQDAVSKGAKLLLGGKALPELGELFYEPTVLTGIKPNMTLYNEEVFGPVVSIINFECEEESLQIANGTRSGLAGYFYSEDVSQIFRVAKKIEVGMVGVNEGAISTAEAPFGGIKESGIGREGSHHGLDEYLYIKYLCVGNL